MLILLRTQVDRTDKTPVTARRARVGGLCGFRSPAERVPIQQQKTGRCANVREHCGHGKRRKRTAAGGFRQREKPQAAKQDKAAGSCASRGGHNCPPCGQFRGFARGVVERAKIALVGSQFEKSPPFQGTRRGCTKKVHGKRKKQQVQRWVKQLRVYREKQRAGPKTCTLPSEKSMLYCTRDPARIRLTIICQKSCSSALQYRLSGIS